MYKTVYYFLRTSVWLCAKSMYVQIKDVIQNYNSVVNNSGIRNLRRAQGRGDVLRNGTGLKTAPTCNRSDLHVHNSALRTVVYSLRVQYT